MCMMEGGRERGWDGAKRDMGYTCVRSLVFFSVNVTFCLEDVVNVFFWRSCNFVSIIGRNCSMFVICEGLVIKSFLLL